MQVLITGGTGFIGQALVQRLMAAGHAVTVWSRHPAQAARQLGAGVRCVATLKAIAATDRIDAIVNLAGARVVGPPWTAARRQVLLDSRVGTTQALLQWLQQTGQRPSVWVQASAIGVGGLPGFISIVPQSISMFVIGMVIAIVVPFVLTCALSMKIVRPGYRVA